MALDVEAVARRQVSDVDACGRVLRVKVERQPLDRSAERAREPRRPLSGDVAERSYVVGPDPDQRRHRHPLFPVPRNEKSGPPTARSLLLGAYPSTAPWK